MVNKIFQFVIDLQPTFEDSSFRVSPEKGREICEVIWWCYSDWMNILKIILIHKRTIFTISRYDGY